MSDPQLSNQAQVHQVTDRETLLQAIADADVGDTIVLAREGNYGNIRIINKAGLRITSQSKQLTIEATFLIDGTSSQIIIENLNLWSDDQHRQQVITIGPQCKKIIIRHCILSSFPVSMNTAQDKLSGDPQNWIDGIRVAGNKCEINNNILANVKRAIQITAAESVIQKNVIQYFSGDAIRVQHHRTQVSHNHISDAILGHSGETTQLDAIALLPPENRYTGGELNGVHIIANSVRSQNRRTTVPGHRQARLQGIVGFDGYFTDLLITENSLVVNTNQGITINGAKNLQLLDNKVIASPSNPHSRPGIHLYLTRISSNPSYPKWLANRTYSVRYGRNQAPVFNFPDEAYESIDLGQNQFDKITHHLTPDDSQEIVRGSQDPSAHNKVTTVPLSPNGNSKSEKVGQRLEHSRENEPKVFSAKSKDAPTTVAKEHIPTVSRRVNVVSNKNSRSTRTNPRGQLHKVSNGGELRQAIQVANEGDTILITRRGNYGNVFIINKSRLRIKSFNTDIPIQISIVIDGSSHTILLENMQLWNNDQSKKQIIITGKSTSNIYIRNCILSTVQVNRNTMRQRYAGNPQQWINGIRMLGSNGQIISNYLMNLKMGISQTGPNTRVQHNLVQFYSEDAIRVSHHGVKVLHNNIYDSVAAYPGQGAHKDSIQLIPPYNVQNAGDLVNVQIVGNIIQSHTQPPVVPIHERGTVQGIFGSDGYFVNTFIAGNTVMVNSDHGITLNGVKNLQLSDNHIVDLEPGNHFNPGIKLYLTRIFQHGKHKWLANRPHSVTLQGNQAPVLNTPNEAYRVTDQGNNTFQRQTHDLARGSHPIIIRNTGEGEPGTTLKNPPTPQVPPATSHPVGSGVSIFAITNKAELDRAVRIAAPGDTILFKKSGNYGQIRLTHKSGVHLRAANTDIVINSNILIDGNSRNIIIDGLTLWFSERNWKPVILTGPETTNVSIRNCLISSVEVSRRQAKNHMIGNPKNWVTGIWLRGNGNEVINNHLVNVRTGIVTNGAYVLIQNNLIQYFCDAGIRIINDHIEVIHNNIYDAIAMEPGSRRMLTGIQLIPAEGRFQGGKIQQLKITHNVIQAKSASSPTQDDRQGLLQGITMHDGYVSGMVLNSNTLVVNTEHGITINGASGLSLNGNRVFDAKPGDPFVPGIKLYYTRTIDVDHARHQTWRTGRDYSVSYSNNQAAEFNIPTIGYDSHDGGGNQFRVISHYQARGVDPALEP